MQAGHLLQELVFPSRYERLREHVGTDVARLLVPPDQATTDAVEDLAYGILHGDEGLFCPLFAVPGTGKTTLCESLEVFHPRLYGPTLDYTDNALTSSQFTEAITRHRAATMPHSDQRITPVNIDSREALPPTAAEMAEVKQFLRTSVGSKTLILWPTTDPTVAEQMARQYEAIAGEVPVHLPLVVAGPDHAAWRSIATDTIQLVNKVDSLELLVNPADYEPADYPSLGAYLRQMSGDFKAQRLQLLRSTRKPISLTILFVSESGDAGVLTQLTSSSRYGLLDGNALVGVIEGSDIGRWWDGRRGLLTRTIVQLNAHAFCLPPTVVIPTLRVFGPESAKETLSTMGVGSKGSNESALRITRSDLGRHLLGQRRSAYETRGNPGESSGAAFALLAEEKAFHNGKDKQLNKGIAAGLGYFLRDDPAKPEVRAEKRLASTQLLPDILIDTEDSGHCLELTWRTGDFLATKRRADAATYILEKMQAYARALQFPGSE